MLSRPLWSPKAPSVSIIVVSPYDADASELLALVQSVEAQDYPEDRFDVVVIIDQYYMGEAVCRRVGVTRSETDWVTFAHIGEPWEPGRLRQLMVERFTSLDEVGVWTKHEWFDNNVEEEL